MRKFLLLCLLAVCLAPTVARAANAQAQEYDELGMALYHQGLYAKSISYFQNAVQADPSDWEGYENLGNAYFKTNDNSDALNAYQKSLQINPDNSTLENIVQNLQNNTAPMANNASENTEQNSPASSPNNSAVPNPPPAGAAPPNPQSSVESEQPVDNNSQVAAPPQPGETIVVSRHRRAWGAYQQPTTYADGLNAIDHAKYWFKFELGYTYAAVPDLINGANNINNGSYFNDDPSGYLNTTYSGSALASNSGANVGGELGFLLSPEWGIGLGIKYVQLNDYTANVAYNDSYGDYENVALSPYVVPLTLDIYYFMPDAGGRFYIKGGVGYYYGDVHVNESYSYSNFYNQQESNNPENWVGDLTSGAVGFQLGIGREFAITRNVGIEIYAEGHYAKITNFQGTLYDQYGNSYNAGLAMGNNNGTVDFDNPAYINAANGEHYATLDYTGFDVGISFNWYSL